MKIKGILSNCREMARAILLIAALGLCLHAGQGASFSRLGANAIFVETDECVLITGFYRMSFTIQLPVKIPIFPSRLNTSCSNSNAKIAKEACDFLKPLLRDFEHKHTLMASRASKLIEKITELVPHTTVGKHQRRGFLTSLAWDYTTWRA